MDCNKLFISIGSVIIDDIILPDGESRMATLGGGAIHAVMGMRVWSQRVGLLSSIGDDFPPGLAQEMEKRFDVQGLIERNIRTSRAWQLFERDGTRNEIFRTRIEEMETNLPHLEDFPDAYTDLAGVHLHCALDEVPDWVNFLRTRGNPIILWEPWDRMCIPENRPLFRKYCPLLDVISPNLREGQALTGEKEPSRVADALLQYGAKVVALRMGADGSLVKSQEDASCFIPCVSPAQLVDVTGAGNAYCGGFIVGLSLTRDIERAGHYAAVAASFTLEQFGALYPVEGLHQRATQRYKERFINTSNVRRKVFDGIAPEWDAHPLPPGVDERARTVAQETLPNPGGIILDIGSGTGSMISFLIKQKADRVISLDISMEMLSRCAEKYSRFPQVTPLEGDSCWIPLRQASITSVSCHGVLPHFDSIHVALEEFQRVLMPGGRLVISHTIGRERVNTIHSHASDKTLRKDYLPPALEVAQILVEMGWDVRKVVDDPDLYLIVADRPVR
jgi:cytidine kinase